MYEELEPIDRNLQYDFNYQQINHLTREVTVLPVSACIYSVLIAQLKSIYFLQGDIIQLKCFYGTEDADGVTLVSNSTTVCIICIPSPMCRAEYIIVRVKQAA